MQRLNSMVAIQQNCETILCQPEDNIGLLDEMISALPDLPQNTLKLQALSICEVFKGILPSYRLNEEELKHKLTQVISKQERSGFIFWFKPLTNRLERSLNLNRKVCGSTPNSFA